MDVPSEILTKRERQQFIAEVQAEAKRLQEAGIVPAPPEQADLPTAEPGRLAQNIRQKPCNTCHEVHPYLSQNCVPILFVNTDPLATALAADWPLISAPDDLVVTELNMSTGDQRTAITRAATEVPS